jgi:hypothetical protein
MAVENSKFVEPPVTVESQPRVIERGEGGSVIYDSAADRRRQAAPLTAAGPAQYRPIVHPTRPTPSAEEQELKDDYIASGLDAYNKGGPPPDTRN